MTIKLVLFLFFLILENCFAQTTFISEQDPIHNLPVGSIFVVKRDIIFRDTDTIYFQDGNIFVKEDIDRNKAYCWLHFTNTQSGFKRIAKDHAFNVIGSDHRVYTSLRDKDFLSVLYFNDPFIKEFACLDGENQEYGFVTQKDFIRNIGKSLFTLMPKYDPIDLSDCCTTGGDPR